MSRYYEEYTPVKKKNTVAIWIVVGLILAAILALSIAFGLVPVIKNAIAKNNKTNVNTSTSVSEDTQKTETDITTLSKPISVQIDDTQTILSWTCKDFTKCVGYVINLNGVEFTVTSNPYTINLEEGKTSTIMVKAKGDGKTYQDSPYSDVIMVTKEFSSELDYQSSIQKLKEYLMLKVQSVSDSEGILTFIEVDNIFALDISSNIAKIWFNFTCVSNGDYGTAVVTIPFDTIQTVHKLSEKLNSSTDIGNVTSIDYSYINPGDANTTLTEYLINNSNFVGTTFGSLKNRGLAVESLCLIAYDLKEDNIENTATYKIKGLVSETGNNGTRYYSYEYKIEQAFQTNATIGEYFGDLNTTSDITVTELTVIDTGVSALAKEMLDFHQSIEEE